MSVSIQINEELIKAVGDIPITLRNGPLGRCLGSFAKPIAQTAGSLATSSRASGSRLKWSKKFKDNPRFQNDSKKHFGHKVLKSAVGVLVGATHPQGNKQQFVMPAKRGETYTRHSWGKLGSTIVYRSRTGKTYTRINRSKPTLASFPQAERATVKAFRQSGGSAEAAFLDQLSKEMKELRIG
ncbi:MAG: hypothetical protein WCO50_00180 [Synechococcus sp. ELA619]